MEISFLGSEESLLIALFLVQEESWEGGKELFLILLGFDHF